MIFYSLIAIMLYVCLLLDVANSDPIPLLLNTKAVGRIIVAETYDYYKLSLSAGDLLTQGEQIQISVMPVGSGRNFSDPDIYIGRGKTTLPTRKKNNWYSEHFGMDIIFISANELTKSGDVLYIGVTCEFGNCDYELLAQIDDPIAVLLDQPVVFSLQKTHLPVFEINFNQTKNNGRLIQKIQASIWSTRLEAFKVQLSSSEKPDLQIEWVPAWMGGQSTLIETENLCSNCTYYLHIFPLEETAEIYMEFRTGVDYFEFTNKNLAFGITPRWKKNCYRRFIDFNDSKVIVSIVLFSGSGTLSLYQNDESNKAPIKTYDIDSELIVSLDKTELGINNTGMLLLCFNSLYQSSTYIFNVVDEIESDALQMTNIVYNGVTIPGYLSPSKATKYMIIDVDSKNEIVIKAEVLSGTPEFYGFICRFDCDVNPQFIEKNFNDLIPALNGVVTISEKINNCRVKNSRFDCFPILIVNCPGITECTYKFVSSYNHKSVQLIENQTIEDIGAVSQPNYYYFSVNDENAESITIVLNNVAGDSNMYISKTDKAPSRSSNGWWSPREVFTPDIVKIKKDAAKTSLVGTYYVGVIPNSFCYYSIMFYTDLVNSYSSRSPILPATELTEGLPTLGFIDEGQDFKIFKFVKSKDSNILKFLLTSEKEPIHMNVFNNDDFMSKYNIETGSFSESQWFSDPLISEIIVESTDQGYKSEGTYYAFVAREKFENSRNATFFVTAVSDNGIINLNDGIPQRLTLIATLYESQKFIVRYSSDEEKIVSINTYYNTDPLTLTSLDRQFSCNGFCDVRRKKTCENSKLCPVDFEIFLGNNTFAAVEIVVKSDQFTSAQLLKFGDSRASSVQYGKTDFYYLPLDNVTLNSALFFTFTQGTGEILSKIISNKYIDVLDFPLDYKDIEEDSSVPVYSTSRAGGRIIDIKEDVFPKCLSSQNEFSACTLLVTVFGGSVGQEVSTDYSTYSIQFSGAPIMVSTDSIIECQLDDSKIINYYFYIDSSIDKFSVTASNMNGDVSLLINKDSQSLNGSFDWAIVPWNSPSVTIGKDDRLFEREKKFGGLYYIEAQGTSHSYFNLYINTHSLNITEVDNWSEGSCSLKKGEICYFSYFISSTRNYAANNDDKLVLVGHINFEFGQAIIYANIENESTRSTEWNMPSENNYYASSLSQNYKNLIKIVPNSEKDQIVIFGIKCTSNCLFDFNVRSISNGEYYLDSYKENIFYTFADKQSTITYTPYERAKQMIINLLDGEGQIQVSKSKFCRQNCTTSDIVYLDTYMFGKGSDIHSIDLSQFASEEYIKLLVKSSSGVDFGYSITIVFERKWNELSLKFPSPVLAKSENIFHQSYLYFSVNESNKKFLVTIKNSFIKSVIRVYGNFFHIENPKSELNLNSEDILTKEPNSSKYEFKYIKQSGVFGYFSIDIPEGLIFENRANFVLLYIETEFANEEGTPTIGSPIFTIIMDTMNGDSISSGGERHKSLKANSQFGDQIEKESVIYELNKNSNSDAVLLKLSMCGQEKLDVKFYSNITHIDNSREEVPYNQLSDFPNYIFSISPALASKYFAVLSSKEKNQKSTYFIAEYDNTFEQLLKLNKTDFDPTLHYELNKESVTLKWNPNKYGLRYAIYIAFEESDAKTLRSSCSIFTMNPDLLHEENGSFEIPFKYFNNKNQIFVSQVALDGMNFDLFNQIEVVINQQPPPRRHGILVLGKFIF